MKRKGVIASFFVTCVVSVLLVVSQQIVAEESKIPNWIKNNAKWWSEGSVGDSDFVQGMQYLIKERILIMPQTESSTSTSKQIPSWVKNNAGWWANGKISEDDFIKGLQHLVANGVISIESDKKIEKSEVMPAATVSKEEDCKKYTVMSQEYTDCVNEIRGQSVITDLKNEFGFSFSKPEDFKISFFLKFDDPNTSSFGGKYFLMFVGKKDPKNWILIATNEKEPCSKLNKFCNLNQQSSFAEYMKENRCGTTELLEVNVNGIYVTKHQLKWPIMTDTLEGDAYLFSGKNVGVLIGGSDSKIVENFVKSVKFEDAIKIEDVPEATTETIKLLHEYIDIRLQDVQHLFLGLGNKYGEEFHYGYAKKGPYGVTDYGFKASVWAEHVCPKEVKMVEEWRYFKKDDRVLTILALSYDPRVTYETIQKKVDSFKP